MNMWTSKQGCGIQGSKVRQMLLWPPFSFHILFTFIYSLCIKKLYCHFIFFGPFCTYSFSRVLALPQVLPFFYFYNSCGHVHSFIILSPSDLPWLILTHFFTVLLLSGLCFFFFYLPLLSAQMCPFLFFPLFLLIVTCTPFLLFILLLVYSIAYVYPVWLDRRLVIYKEDEREPWGVRLYIGYSYLADEVTSLDSPLLFCRISLFAWPATFIRTSSDLRILNFFPLW